MLLRKGRIKSLAICLVLISSTTVNCFAFNRISHTRRKLNFTKRRYRLDGSDLPTVPNNDETTMSATATAFASNILTTNPNDSFMSSSTIRLPTWLEYQDGGRADKKIYELQDAMTPYLTDSEADVVIRAIREASEDNPKKVAGAAEFCLILVETMEMGADTLIAAAFHYCTCVEARETIPPSYAMNSAYYWNEHYDYECSYGIDRYNKEAVDIAHNAAKLKRSETLATSVVSSGRSNKVALGSNEADNLRRLLLSETGDWRALAIRCAACLFRLRGLLRSRTMTNIDFQTTSEELFVSREAFHIYASLASQLGMHRLKNEIEGAAFKLLYPRQYGAVTSITSQEKVKSNRFGMFRDSEGRMASVADGMKFVLNELGEKVKFLLVNDSSLMDHLEKVVVSARVKEPYSMWKKMLRLKTRSVLDVPDAIALRIVLDASKVSPDENDEITRSRGQCLCYYVHKMLTENWGRMGVSRVKDYIMHPKENGYQSLHFTASYVYEGQEFPFEIQIRSSDMHRTAEYGLAAHWEYKLKGKDRSILDTRGANENFISEIDPLWSALHEKSQSNPFESSILSHKKDNPKFEGSSVSQTLLHKHFLEQNQIRAERAKARAEHLRPYIEALKAQSNLAKENVFVFLSSSSDRTENGKVISLPAGACVIDAVRAGEKAYGKEFILVRRGAMVFDQNGIEARMTQRLNNGDILFVPMADH